MEEYIELANSEFQEAICSYSEREKANEWKSAEEDFKKISFKVEELIYGDGNRHINKTSHQAIRFSCDIPNNWEVLANILYGSNIEKILPCILFTWLLNMNKKLWNRLQEKITRKHITFKDKRIANLLAKSKSKTDSTNNEIKIATLLFDNISEIPHDCDLAFMMIIRFLALFKLSICAKADVNFCISWFESKYGILRHIFTYDEYKSNSLRDNALEDIICELLELKIEERPLVKCFKQFNERISNIKNKIMLLKFNNKNDIENKIEELRSDIRQLKNCYISFRYELFKSNYLLNSQLSGSVNHPLIQMCQFFDTDLSIKKLKTENPQNNKSENENSLPNFILKDVKAKFKNISKLYLVVTVPSGDSFCTGKNYYEIFHIPICNCENISSSNSYNVQLNADVSELTYHPPIPVNKLKMIYSKNIFIFEGTLKILSAKYNAYDTEFNLSCDELKVDNAHMINTQFKFKDNSEVLKSKEKEDKWYNSIFLLFANEI